jgi:uncharacterized protein YcgI (DUF1989 family)
MPSDSAAIRLAPRSGHAFIVRDSEAVRFDLPDGPQVVDLIAYNLDDPTERFSSSNTRQEFGAHLTVGDDLLSDLPRGRPMLSIAADSLADHSRAMTGPGRPHDLLFGSCNRMLRRKRYAQDTPGCREILGDAIRTYGLSDHDVVDPFNIFMTTGLDDSDRLFFVPSIARAGDYLEMRARLNCLIAVSACPGASSGPVGHDVSISIARQT